jgi:hypothetical protein
MTSKHGTATFFMFYSPFLSDVAAILNEISAQRFTILPPFYLPASIGLQGEIQVGQTS